VGINLTQANRVFLMEPHFNPAVEAQAIGRVHRLGQKRKVEIIRLIINNSFESRMLSFLGNKYGLSFEEAVVPQESSSNDHDSDNDLDFLNEKKKPVKAAKCQSKEVDDLVGNLCTDKAKIVCEEFDELFGVKDLLAKADPEVDTAEENAARAAHSSSSHYDPIDFSDSDDDSLFPDTAMSRHV
jgi:hypothetical protein